MSAQLYRVHLADGGVRRVRVTATSANRYVEGDRYPLSVPVAEAVAAHGRSSACRHRRAWCSRRKTRAQSRSGGR